MGLAGIPFCQETRSVIITNFVNETGYEGNWDIEKELPRLLSGAFAQDYGETPVWRNRSWRDDANDLRRKFPEAIIITGVIKEFTYFTSTQKPIWPLINRTIRARVDIALDIVKDGQVYTQECEGEKIDNKLSVDLFTPQEEDEDNENFDNVKFGDEQFWKSFPGKAVNKAIQECMSFVKLWVPKKK